MKFLLCILIISSMVPKVIFECNKDADINNWVITDDGVMGGESSSTFSLNEDGNGVFKGEVSLENNGGFSSVRYNFERLHIEGHTKIVLKLRGDGKQYQFRIKANTVDYFSYTIPFLTSGEWQEIEITLKDMVPAFRGRKLDQPNFENDSLEQITFLIGNKKAENFELLIDRGELR